MYRWTLKTRHDTETPDLFDLEQSCSMTEQSTSMQNHSAEPLSLYGRQETSLRRDINGPTFARLGEWDGN